MRLVAEWVSDHADELAACWEEATHGEEPGTNRATAVGASTSPTPKYYTTHVVQLRFADGVEKTVDLDSYWPLPHGNVFTAIRTDSAGFTGLKVGPEWRGSCA